MSEGLGSVPPRKIDRAIRLTYGQAILGSIYAASTGGMFLIGYALRLGADNVHIGLLTTVPMLMVGMQLLSSALVERGVSRRRLTIAGFLANVSCWGLIILIPFVAARAAPEIKIAALIAIVGLVSLFAQVSGNARGSWLGDLIPASSRATFFGRLNMYAGLIGVLFALVEGTVLDRVKTMGIGAFSGLFAFGMLFGLATTLLFLPQPDLPLSKRPAACGFFSQARETFANRGLMTLMLCMLLWSVQSIAGPFYPTYMLRDLKMPFLGVGAVTAVQTLTMLASSPFWGRVIDRWGCRPVLITCLLGAAPAQLVWIGITRASTVYAVIPLTNLLTGFAAAGLFVAVNTLLYKITPSAGRSVQFAIYSAIITLAVAPLPTLGGYLPRLLQTIGLHYDVRAAFYAPIPFLFAAAWAARRIQEPGARRARELIRNLPRLLRGR